MTHIFPAVRWTDSTGTVFATVALQLLRKVAERVRPPRSLLLPFRHGYPLHEPGRPASQSAILEAALRLLEDERLRPPALVALEESR